MSDIENKNEQAREESTGKGARYHHMSRHRASGTSHIWAGVFILLIGIALLLPLPDWVISWQMFLIAMGMFIGIRHSFRGGAWLILILIGGIFLFRDLYPEITFERYILPGILILLGLFFIMRPKRKRRAFCGGYDSPAEENEPGTNTAYTSEDFVDSTSIFGGVKKNIMSKNFRGGDIVNIFGGSEINLGQADIQGTVELEVTQIFGGTKLFVPSNWEVKPEMMAVLGGIEDKRNLTTNPNPGKVLVLKGTSIFGGIEIRNF